jgi:hypothetical protein
MLTYCGRPRSASFCDHFPYIGPRYAREVIAERCSMWVALATAIIGHPGSKGAEGESMRHFLIGLTLTLILIVSIGVGVAVALWPSWRHVLQ